MTKKSKTRIATGSNDTLDAIEACGERLSDLSLEDAISEMKSRFFVLRAAISGSDFVDNETRQGVLWLASDIVSAMERLAEAFKNERQLRVAEERQ